MERLKAFAETLIKELDCSAPYDSIRRTENKTNLFLGGKGTNYLMDRIVEWCKKVNPPIDKVEREVFNAIKEDIIAGIEDLDLDYYNFITTYLDIDSVLEGLKERIRKAKSIEELDKVLNTISSEVREELQEMAERVELYDCIECLEFLKENASPCMAETFEIAASYGFSLSDMDICRLANIYLFDKLLEEIGAFVEDLEDKIDEYNPLL